MDVAALAYEIGGKMPKSEIYGLTSQLQRAAVSVAANIAEGHGRETTGDYLRFLAIASGSLTELETHLLLSQRLGLLKDGDIASAMKAADELGKMLRALKRSLSAKVSARNPGRDLSSPRS